MPTHTVETKKEKHTERAREELRMAHEAYTLARILSEHFAAAHPWTVPLTAAVEPRAGFGLWTH